MSEAKARELLGEIREWREQAAAFGDPPKLALLDRIIAYLAAVPAPPAEPTAAPAEAPPAGTTRDWRWCTSRGYEIGEKCTDAADCAKNGCAKGRMLRAGICPDCNGEGCVACYAP